MFELTQEVRSRVFDNLLDYLMHNFHVDPRLRLLVQVSRIYGMFNIESHIPPSLTLSSGVYLQKFTLYDYTLTILSRLLVQKESSTTCQSSPSRFPFGASENVFPFYDLRTYGQSLLDPTPSLVSRSCLLGFSQPLRVRREGCKLRSPLYELPRIMRSKQRFLLFSINTNNIISRLPFVKGPSD
jgi:hypothetical protein